MRTHLFTTHPFKMAGRAGHAGGGTDVRANRKLVGGGGPTERQQHKLRANKSHKWPTKKSGLFW